MKSIARLLWLFPLGAIMCVIWIILGLVFIIIPPLRKNCINIFNYALNPFDVTVEMYPGAFVLANIIWALPALPLALIACLFGVVYGVTIIGIPLAKHCFKLAHLMLTPFGSLVYLEG